MASPANVSPLAGKKKARSGNLESFPLLRGKGKACGRRKFTVHFLPLQ
jgi:hypothetical protein